MKVRLEGCRHATLHFHHFMYRGSRLHSAACFLHADAAHAFFSAAANTTGASRRELEALEEKLELSERARAEAEARAEEARARVAEVQRPKQPACCGVS